MTTRTKFLAKFLLLYFFFISLDLTSIVNGEEQYSYGRYGGDILCNLSFSEDGSNEAEPFDCSSSTHVFCLGIVKNETGLESQLNFSYRAQINDETDLGYIAKMEVAMLRVIEESVLDCSSFPNQRKRLLTQQKVAIIAADSLPLDTKSDDECLVEEEARYCSVVNARLSFVVNEENEEEAAKHQILDAIESAMESKEFIDINDDPNLINVAYGIDPNAVAEPLSGVSDFDTNSAEGSSLPLALGAGAIFVLVVGSLVARRRKRRQENDISIPIDDLSVNNDISFDNESMFLPSYDFKTIVSPNGETEINVSYESIASGDTTMI
uniref:Uncharacterized protein n=1 Tax=Corethron hystrix TaxID=216773 RepID=A0A6U5HEA6_9STRA|mmetsp:Transcript_29714/g.68217  ORF Transcript_29714/g.68217 Transcript_29714/m.68217 type:complete len:324 (+) Transcript_29714:165-1136(+)